MIEDVFREALPLEGCLKIGHLRVRNGDLEAGADDVRNDLDGAIDVRGRIEPIEQGLTGRHSRSSWE
jgi:hypothetical protein